MILLVGPAIGLLVLKAVYYFPLAFGQSTEYLAGWGWLGVPLGAIAGAVAASVSSKLLLRRLELPMGEASTRRFFRRVRRVGCYRHRAEQLCAWGLGSDALTSGLGKAGRGQIRPLGAGARFTW